VACRVPKIVCVPQTICTTSTVGRRHRLGDIESLPVVNQPPLRASALVGHLARVLGTAGESVLAQVGVRPRQLIAMTFLRDHGERSQQALAADLQIDRTNLVGLLNALEQDGLVERRRSPEDRRRHTVALTEAGRERLAQAEFALAAVEDHVLGALTVAEREALHDLLQKATAGRLTPPADC
jgi:MarR family transcriptional regulator, lower aerobic nicotinate degradation pathway regulator